MKSFSTSLNDLYPAGGYCTDVEAFYDKDQISYVIDEFGREWKPKELSINDLVHLGEHLVMNLSADQVATPCNYCGRAVCE